MLEAIIQKVDSSAARHPNGGKVAGSFADRPTAQERGAEGSRSSEGRDAAQEKAQLEADATKAGNRNSMREKCESEQGIAVSNGSSDVAAERPMAEL